MSKYVIRWQVLEPGKVASDPKEAVKGLEMVKQDLEGSAITEWWSCVGGMKGYLFADGDSKDVLRILSGYNRAVSYYVQEVLSLDEVIQIAKSRVE